MPGESAESAKGGDGTLQGSNAPSVIAGRVNSKKKVTKTKNKKAVAPVPNPAASILIQKQQQDEEEDLPDIWRLSVGQSVVWILVFFLF